MFPVSCATQMVKQSAYDRDAFKLLFHDGFPGGSDGKASAYNAGDPGSIPGSGRSPEKEMAIHSSTLAWKIPSMEEPDRPQSMGSRRVGHD